MINVNEFKPGITFQDEGDIFIVLEAQHSKQGRGQANVKAKVKNLRTGSTTIKTYTGGDKVKPAHIDKRRMNFLYSDGENIILMDNETFEQVEIPVKNVEWELNFLKEGSEVQIRKFEEEVLDIELPINVDLLVQSAPDAVKGNTTTNPQKKVILETGFEMETPMFIKEGDSIIVSTETGKYVGKNNK
ncbi:elongation factor P [Mycoplasmopsis pullorum]|uniref:Elongation factor P n=1 Tax=Mycoplasmopsis pullorum TaxID=48003 RepID=A0A1L4FRN4_9BACT|nr:elongation factor P [Mycoplasmopsis pullorum]APJ38254.1 elongation factor P [Mycoplasmopsis pullorum]TNK82355.1 elongation factor P [Mycoplasmopsis pullorum]TNK82828.1 elongation factor P [Mycoplasmopsis pullorum]TNK83554.1 elongation factor P [Mycoplasmopsis pullorum]TNK84405.1 elongation factor P [Mycoplasmopsis pullorum]